MESQPGWGLEPPGELFQQYLSVLRLWFTQPGMTPRQRTFKSSPNTCQCILRLFPRLGCCEECCYEHRGICIFLNYSFVWIYAQSEVAGSHGNCIFSFLRKLHTVFHRGCKKLHSHKWYRRVPFSPYPLQHLLFLMGDILTGVRWYHPIAVIHSSLITLEINCASR